MALKNLLKFFNSHLSGLVLKRNAVIASHINHVFPGSSKILPDMRKAYFQFEEGNEKFDVKIFFRQDYVNSTKLLCFNRNKSEKVDTFLGRLNTKLQDVLNKKVKKGSTSTLDSPVSTNVNSVFLVNGEPLHDTTFEDIFNSKANEQLKLIILGTDYDVIINPPTVDEISLPDVVRAGSPVYPIKFETKCLDISRSTFTWFKSLCGTKKWEECGSGFCYIPTEQDVNHYLRFQCLPRNESYSGAVHVAVTVSKVNDFSALKVIKNRHKYTLDKTTCDELRIVSYNILADTYAHTKEAKTSLFNYCNPAILELGYRKDLLFSELIGYNADLMCLQEVDKKVFLNHFDPVFSQLGFQGIYSEKEQAREGCAFFYNTKKFKLLDNVQHVYTMELFENPIMLDLKEKIQDNEALKERLAALQTLVQIVVLERLENSQDLIVLGNTHLYFHPDADHIRLLQAIIGFRLLQNKVQTTKEMNPEKRISTFFCGDFNTVPECGIYQFITTGSVDSSSIDWKSNEKEAIKDVSFSHSIKMESACGTPEYTNFTHLFKACLDYIYYQTDYLQVKQFVPFPTEEELREQVALPSEFFPSDHLALIADFKWKV